MFRAEAKLRLFNSRMSLSEISKALERNPDFGHSIGDSISSRSKSARSETLWGLAADSEAAFSDQIAFLLQEFRKIKKKIEFDHSMYADIFCLLSSDNGQGSIEMTPNISKEIGALDLGLIFDVYSERD